jgi:NAD(P)-dependent dehydrogenase (short-subunit alcohol dehydrogenase family)
MSDLAIGDAVSILITGASSGIGAAASIELTRRGFPVIATGRSQEKLARTHARMLAAAPDGCTVPEPIQADLSSFAGVQRLATDVLNRRTPIDVLVNNAAVQPHHRSVSPDGYELTLAVNHLAPFLLTHYLRDCLTESGGRVITTSSDTHAKATIDLTDLQMEQAWSPQKAYGRSKLANILFSLELSRRSRIPASCFHPGVICTDINRESPWVRITRPFEHLIFSRPERGADTLVWLATDEEGRSPSAVYYENRAPGKCSDAAKDIDLAEHLWRVSAQLVGVDAEGSKAP